MGTKTSLSKNATGETEYYVQPDGLLFFFFEGSLSFSTLAAGSDKVGARYFLPELLPILSDLGSVTSFCFLVVAVSS